MLKQNSERRSVHRGVFFEEWAIGITGLAIVTTNRAIASAANIEGCHTEREQDAKDRV